MGKEFTFGGKQNRLHCSLVEPGERTDLRKEYLPYAPLWKKIIYHFEHFLKKLFSCIH